MSLEQKINGAIKEAMLAKEKGKLRGLRAVKAAIQLAKTEKGAPDTLSEEREIQILQKLIKQRKESLQIFKDQNRSDLAAKEAEEIETIQVFLPEQMDEAAIRTSVEAVIAEVGASGMRDMGKVMGILTKKLAGKADGKMVADIVKNMLS